MSTRPALVLIGDSIRNGYCEHVVRELADEVAVFAPAQNGGDSRNVLAHLDEWVLKQQPDLVLTVSPRRNARPPHNLVPQSRSWEEHVFRGEAFVR